MIANAYIGPFTTIGQDCTIHPHVTIRERCQIGNRVILQPGAVIGSCGFGYSTDKMGNHTKLEQMGIVAIEDDVEIGANTTIDRSRFKVTKIGCGTKIDNLVQIGHGVSIGKSNLIVAQVGFSGSSSTGNWVVVGGQSGFVGHVSIADGVMIAAKSGISKSITKKGQFGGNPAVPLEEHQRTAVYLRNIKRYIDKIQALEERLSHLENHEHLKK